MGSFSQMAAAVTHYVSPERLAYIAANIPKIAIVTEEDVRSRGGRLYVVLPVS